MEPKGIDGISFQPFRHTAVDPKTCVSPETGHKASETQEPRILPRHFVKFGSGQSEPEPNHETQFIPCRESLQTDEATPFSFEAYLKDKHNFIVTVSGLGLHTRALNLKPLT